MRFRSAVLLAALAIAPVCAERIKDSDERHDVDSTLSADGVDCGGGGLCSGGNNGDGGCGCDTIRRSTAGGVAVGWWRGRAEKKDAVVVGGERGDGDNVDNVRASGIGRQARYPLAVVGPCPPCLASSTPPPHRVVRRPPAFLFDCCVLDRRRRGGQHGSRAAAMAQAAPRR